MQLTRKRVGLGVMLAGMILMASGCQSCLLRLAVMGPQSPSFSSTARAGQTQTFHKFETYVHGPSQFSMEVEGDDARCRLALEAADGTAWKHDEASGSHKARCSFFATLDGQHDLSLVASANGGAGGFFAVYPDVETPWGLADLVPLGLLSLVVGAVVVLVNRRQPAAVS